MNVRTRRRVAALLLLLALLLPQAVQADSASITCYGEDLTSEQYTLVLDLLEADPATDTLIPVTHEDEVSLLGDIVPAEKIGSRSLSSARVTLAQEGAGIAVTVYNIDWVTPQMYASALSTAGVQDAVIVVAAPVSVSGTAALAGHPQGLRERGGHGAERSGQGRRRQRDGPDRRPCRTSSAPTRR